MEALQITYLGLDPSDALSELIRKETEKLESFFERIVSCHVRVEREQQHLRHGRPFRVRIDLLVPGSELSIDTARSVNVKAGDDEEAPMRRKSAEVDAKHKDPALTVRDAFRRARRRLQDYARRPVGSHVRSSLR